MLKIYLRVLYIKRDPQINIRHFLPLEVVGRVSETQLQVGENLNYLILRFKGSDYCNYEYIYIS